MNNTTIIIRIHFAVTLFQHSPLTRRVFYRNIRQERGLIISSIRRTSSSILSLKNDWHIYKSSEFFFISSIVILKGMESSSASICISIKLIHHHHHNTRLAHHNTRLALRRSCQDGSSVLILFYVTTIKLEARY